MAGSLEGSGGACSRGRASDPPAESQEPAGPQGISRIATGEGYGGPVALTTSGETHATPEFGCVQPTPGRASRVTRTDQQPVDHAQDTEQPDPRRWKALAV